MCSYPAGAESNLNGEQRTEDGDQGSGAEVRVEGVRDGGPGVVIEVNHDTISCSTSGCREATFSRVAAPPDGTFLPCYHSSSVLQSLICWPWLSSLPISTRTSRMPEALERECRKASLRR